MQCSIANQKFGVNLQSKTVSNSLKLKILFFSLFDRRQFTIENSVSNVFKTFVSC